MIWPMLFIMIPLHSAEESQRSNVCLGLLCSTNILSLRLSPLNPTIRPMFGRYKQTYSLLLWDTKTVIEEV